MQRTPYALLSINSITYKSNSVFKAQVVCHSKIAAVRYQKHIRAALSERLDRERLKPIPDLSLIRKIEFLKAVVVVSADPTNEAAVISMSRLLRLKR